MSVKTGMLVSSCISLPQLAQAAAPDKVDRPATEQQMELPLRQVSFNGNRKLQTAVLRRVADPYLGMKLTAASIEQLRMALTQLYVDRGYINSGLILDPHRPYSDGQLSFLVIEGKISRVNVHGQRGLRSSYISGRLRGDDDEVLNVNLLRERYQHLLDDPLFSLVKTRLEPGTDAGDAVLEVEVERARPYSLVFALNNYRPPSIYEKAYDLTGEVRDLTGFGDVLDVDLSGPLNFEGGVGYGVTWQVPLNRFGTAVALSLQRAETVVSEQPLSTLDIRSVIERQELKLAQPLWRNLQQQVSLGASIARERNATTLAGMSFSFLPGADNGTTRAITERLIPEYSYRSTRQYLGVRLTFLHTYLQNYPDGPVAYPAPRQQYFVWTVQAQHLLEIPRTPFEAESKATVQRGPDRVSDLHSLPVGGVSSVRGFRENERLAGDVDNLNFDVRWLLSRSNGWGHPGLTLGMFFDWANARDVGERWQTFSSTGLTARAKFPHLQLDLAYGVPLIHPAFTSQEHGSWQDHGIHVQLAASL